MAETGKGGGNQGGGERGRGNVGGERDGRKEARKEEGREGGRQKWRGTETEKQRQRCRRDRLSHHLGHTTHKKHKRCI